MATIREVLTTDNPSAVAYSADDYLRDVREEGIEATWDSIIGLLGRHPDDMPPLLSTGNLGELYEMGLAETDKIAKKELGKYYTPADVAAVMSEWLDGIDLPEVADVACGTGNLILAYLSRIGGERASDLLSGSHVWLYDADPLALRIAVAIIGTRYGREASAGIHAVAGDFLSAGTPLPAGCKVISNPPYYKIREFGGDWDVTPAMRQCKDLYGAFLEKIWRQSEGSVVICPYSFLGSSKFSLLREQMEGRSGHVVSFDNIPGHVFTGRKHGIFNTNKSNSVRAAIAVTHPAGQGDGEDAGYRISPLIRFSTGERDRLMRAGTLEELLPDGAAEAGPLGFPKCMPGLEGVLEAWQESATETFGKVVSPRPTRERSLCVPTTCRYFLSGTARDLDRTGKRLWWLVDDTDFDYAYAMLNSSFAYWHWRLYDGGINYAVGLLQAMPSFSGIFRSDDGLATRLREIVSEMVSREDDFLVYKLNAGAAQENVKFPIEYRDRLNRILLDALGQGEVSERMFDRVHAPHVFDNQASEEGVHHG